MTGASTDRGMYVEPGGALGVVLAALKGVKAERGGGNRYVALCPAHEDHEPSLAITLGQDRKVLLTCRAGCKTKDVVIAAGLEMSDLFADNGRSLNGSGLGPEVARYTYSDEDGSPLFHVVRYEPAGQTKTFRQQAASGAWGMNGVRRVPYRLPELIEAIALGKRIYIAEGEKDVESLRKRGLAATTNVGGAKKWRDEDSEYLRGATDVVVLEDNDRAGREHAPIVMRSLGAIGITARHLALPGLPEKGDVSDFLVRHTVLELEKLASAAPLGGSPDGSIGSPVSTDPKSSRTYALTTVDLALARQLDEYNRQPVDAIPTGFRTWDLSCDAGCGLELGWHVTIGGASGIGKSMLALNIADAALEASRSVGYVSLEMSTRQLLGRLYPLATSTPSGPLKRGPRYESSAFLRTASEFAERCRCRGAKLIIVERPPSDLASVIAAARACVAQGCSLIIIDYFQLIHAPGNTGIDEVKRISGALRDVAFHENVVTVQLSQFTRAALSGKDADRSPSIHNLTGGSPIENDSDQVVLIDHTSKDPSGSSTRGYLLNLAKNRHGPKAEFRTVWDYRTYRITQAVELEDDGRVGRPGGNR
jgi:hypothetical protein